MALPLVGGLPILSAAEKSSPREWTYRKDTTEFAVDAARTGQITRWTIGGKTLVDSATPASPLALTLADGTTAVFSADRVSSETPDSLTLTGRLTAPALPAPLPVTLRYAISENGARATVTIDTASPPETADIRGYAWSLPLALNPRKRIFYLGDHGLRWDTRYFYQLTYNPRPGRATVMPVPDRNEWRLFSLDQLGPDAYRLWKSETHDTAALVMHEGRAPAPAVQLYDEQGGIVVEYPALRAKAPKSLSVNAADGGLVRVQLAPDSLRHAASAWPDIFGSQEITLVALASEEQALATQDALVARHQNDFTPMPDAHAVLREAKPLLSTPVSAGLATGGYPFASGELRDASRIRVEIAGRDVPVQSRPLAFWPDGSVKWALLTFPHDPADSVADCPPPRVSLRDGSFIPVRIKISDTISASPAGALAVSRGADGSVRVRDGDFDAVLTTGEHWLSRLAWNGVTLIDASAPALAATAYANFLLDPESVPAFDLSPAGGRVESGLLRVTDLSVEESSPLRAVVRLEGLTTNAEPARIVLRLEFLAGQPGIRIAHSIVFRNKDPRRAFLAGLGLDLPLSPALLRGENTRRIQLLQAASFHRVLTVDGVATPAPSDAPGWLRIGKGDLGLVASIRNFREQSPNAITADFVARRLRIELWPADTAPADMRRYSNHAHVAQLESAPSDKEAWGGTGYYATDPVYGVSRSHDILLSLDRGGENADARAASLAADFQSGPLLYAGRDHYVGTGVILPAASEKDWPRSWDAWTRAVRFFLFHRELHSWYGFWNYGDFRHRFASGYGWSHPVETLEGLLSGAIEDDSRALRELRVPDYYPANDWNFDNGAYGWTNTEGLPGLFLAHEYLRHGNRQVYFASQAMARYSRDVIVRHEGRWLGRGTRHGVQPWSDGNHDERQTTATEYRLDYLLGGDGRTRDLIENLYQNVYTKGEIKHEPSYHSGRIGGLLFHWELTGDSGEADTLRRYVHTFATEKGVYSAPAVRFPQIEVLAPPQGLHSGGIFFTTFGAMHALIEYAHLTQDPVLHHALLKTADDVLKRTDLKRRTLGSNLDAHWSALAYAALHAPEPQPYRDLLAAYMETSGWARAYQPVTDNPAHWTGPTGFMRSSVAHYFFWGNWAPYVNLAIGSPEIWTPRIAADIAKTERAGAPVAPFRTGWQSDFDKVPAIEAYLGYQQPWRKNPPPSLRARAASATESGSGASQDVE